ncbi:Beta-ketoacyl synthase, N-terminal domain [Modicisalibacter ilicicola DSM 19980]|uniref:Beta-ketoacyl synthase, N-terminal domain n=1 Tax=Modicisalibacter ilicicola DSM 19980 TaxID=1121942 RepID=A0A1M4ZTH2_9GAMM|nr:beta-ketoacyl synthase chain length factor [Halomonas ilicicola]SHF21245.1 Beta-ketoacyl synthase, N-terminal domain [Halomonas ilicicola DSM 19980]
MTTATLTLEDWRAWQPGRTPLDDRRLSVEERPGATSLPAMLRRRLNGPGRAVCDMLAALDPGADCVLLHASRHGDAARTLEMLYALTEGEPLSPARFGMSVHNAIVGVHSIASGNRRSLQAIAASGAEVSALFSEARGYLAEGEPQLIAVFSDAPVPARFAYHETHSEPASAVALRLGLATTPSAGRPLTSHDADEAMLRDARPPHPSDVIAWLLGEAPLICPTRRLMWILDS